MLRLKGMEKRWKIYSNNWVKNANDVVAKVKKLIEIEGNADADVVQGYFLICGQEASTSMLIEIKEEALKDPKIYNWGA